MAIDFNMLGLFVKYWICHYLNSTCTVRMKWNQMVLNESKFDQKTTKQYNFRVSREMVRYSASVEDLEAWPRKIILFIKTNQQYSRFLSHGAQK